MCNLKLQLIWAQKMMLHKFSATFGLNFENKDPACVSRISSEMFSEPYGGPGLHQKQILFVLFLLAAASCDFV